MPDFRLPAAAYFVWVFIMDNIKIAIALDAKGPLGKVPELFSQTEYLLLMETGPGTVREVFERQGRQDADLARKILEWDCECVLCGPIEKESFLLIADEGAVTRYNAADLSLDKALAAFKADALELIRDHIGGQGCESGADSTHRECREHD